MENAWHDFMKKYAGRGISRSRLSEMYRKQQEEKGVSVKSKSVSSVRKRLEKVHSKDCITRSKLPLKPHQLEVVNKLKDSRGVIAVHSTGSGKTLTAVCASQCYLDAHPNGTVIIVCPKSLISNFQKGMRAYGADPSDGRYEYYTFDGFANKFIENSEYCKDKMLIVDEAHNLRTEIKKNSYIDEETNKKIVDIKEGKKAYSVLKCAKKSTKILLLTATPMVNEPYDMLNLLNMVSDKPISDEIFKDDSLFKKAINKYVCYYIINKSPPDYPDVVQEDVYFEMSEEYYKKYFQIQQNMVEKLANEKNLVAFYNGIRRGCNASNIEGLGVKGGPKIRWTMVQLNKGERTLVYSSFKDSGIYIIAEKLKKNKIPFSIVEGGMTEKNREKAVDDYNSGRTNIILISKAGGEGLDLKGTKNVIVLEPGWNEATIEQAVSRAVRYKSHEGYPYQTVNIYNLIIIKPPNYKQIEKYDKVDQTCDQFLYVHSAKKQKLIRHFMNLMKRYSYGKRAEDYGSDEERKEKELEQKEVEKSLSRRQNKKDVSLSTQLKRSIAKQMKKTKYKKFIEINGFIQLNNSTFDIIADKDCNKNITEIMITPDKLLCNYIMNNKLVENASALDLAILTGNYSSIIPIINILNEEYKERIKNIIENVYNNTEDEDAISILLKYMPWRTKKKIQKKTEEKRLENSELVQSIENGNPKKEIVNIMNRLDPDIDYDRMVLETAVLHLLILRGEENDKYNKEILDRILGKLDKQIYKIYNREDWEPFIDYLISKEVVLIEKKKEASICDDSVDTELFIRIYDLIENKQRKYLDLVDEELENGYSRLVLECMLIYVLTESDITEKYNIKLIERLLKRLDNKITQTYVENKDLWDKYKDVLELRFD